MDPRLDPLVSARTSPLRKADRRDAPVLCDNHSESHRPGRLHGSATRQVPCHGDRAGVRPCQTGWLTRSRRLREPSSSPPECPTWSAERSTSSAERPTWAAEHSAEEDEHSAGEDERSAGEVEHSAEEDERSAEEVERSAGEVERSAEEDEHSAEEVEHSAEEDERSAEEVEHSAKEVERSAEGVGHSAAPEERSAEEIARFQGRLLRPGARPGLAESLLAQARSVAGTWAVGLD